MAILPPGPPIRADDWKGWVDLLDSIGLDTSRLRNQWRDGKTVAEERHDARQAQLWVDHIHNQRLAAHRANRDQDNAEDERRLGEIPVWTAEQSARLRHIAQTGQFPPAGWKP